MPQPPYTQPPQPHVPHLPFLPQTRGAGVGGVGHARTTSASIARQAGRQEVPIEVPKAKGMWPIEVPIWSRPGIFEATAVRFA